jgi:nucleoside-diphosphate-sugar epimerase
MKSPSLPRVLVTGGAGYVGAVLVPKLLARGHQVRVLDWYIYGDVLQPHPNLEQVKGDMRDSDTLAQVLRDCDAVIHLACISNDPSAELNPELTRSVNMDAFAPLVKASKQAGVRRFIYASTSSVYGLSDQPDVTEDHPLVPLTDYNRYKGLCEPILLDEQTDSFVPVIIRPATVCGYSPRLRLDLSVNILTNLAVNKGEITVFGGSQMRPNIHIQDITDLYCQLLEEPDARIAGQTFNAGYQNRTIADIAQIVKGIVSKRVPGREDMRIITTPSDDIRSYHISAEKIRRHLGFVPRYTIEDAVNELVDAFLAGKIPNSLTDDVYYNIRTMRRLEPQLAMGMTV